MYEKVTVEAIFCCCEKCGHKWHSLAKRPPIICANSDCRSRQWDGPKVKRKPVRGLKVELPKPTRIRRNDDDTEF